MPFAALATVKFGDGTDEASSTEVGTLASDGTEVTVSDLGTGSAVFDGVALRDACTRLSAHISATPTLGVKMDVEDDPASTADARQIEYVEPSTTGPAVRRGTRAT